MKYLTDTIVEYITSETTDARTYRYVLPSYPSSLLVSLGKQLEEYYYRITDRKIKFEYSIAYRLGQQWHIKGDNKDKENYSYIIEKGWYNQEDNLTSIRNIVKDPSYDTLVILLAGYEHINDRASLQDFFHLDLPTLWEISMKGSFKAWVFYALKNRINPDDHETDLEKISQLLKSLYEFGLVDVLKVSSFLEGLDFSGIMSGNDAYRVILNNLSYFNLPCMVGLANRRYRKSFSNFILAAQHFFNYSEYLDPGKRKNALNKIQEFKSASDKAEPETEQLGEYAYRDHLLEDLSSYIEQRDEAAAARLFKADFIYIYDEILRFKVSKGTTSKDTAKKVHGLPPEIFLRAVWLSLSDFQKREGLHSTELTEEIQKLTVKSINFKHDFEAGDEDESKTEKEHAEEFLKKILGGLDDYLMENLDVLVEDHEIAFHSYLSPSEQNEDLTYSKNSRAEPVLTFTVEVSSQSKRKLQRTFRWPLPHYHQIRLLKDLFKLAKDAFRNSTTGDPLPAFAIPYMAEIFRATEEEEISRLLDTSLKSESWQMVDLLKVTKDHTDQVKRLLKQLSRSYQEFINSFHDYGLFYAMLNEYDSMRQDFANAYKKYIQLNGQCPLGPQLLKAFMIVNLEEAKQANWAWYSYMPASMVTPLHPAVLEMMLHQHRFLFDSFCYYLRSLSEERNLTEKRWNQVVDLARMQWPVFGTLKNMSQELDTSVRSYEYLHLVGNCQDKSSFINLRTLTKEEDDDEEEIVDSELFRDTRASQLIHKVLKEYHDLYYFADDGISVGAYCGKETQPVIAGIDTYLNELLKKRGDREYTIQLTIFSDNKDDSTVMQWIDAWKDRWQSAELSTGKQHYANCRISIAYRVVSRKEDQEQFKRLLKEVGLDVLFFADFVDAGASKFNELQKDPYLESGDYRKFPVLEKACCRVVGGGQEQYRYRILSNQRFQVGLLHSEVMALIKSINVDSNKKHAVTSFSNFEPWMELIDAAHEGNNWVVCIAPAVDENLLENNKSKNKTRDIIGFGSGVGAHGESNYTVSTERFAMLDIQKQIASQIAALLGPWGKNEYDYVADSLVKDASKISGLSLIQATGPERYVRELIAHAMVRKLLLPQSECFCDEIISLDAFSHWFEEVDDSRRPDLLRLCAVIKDGYFHIQAQIIECKLALESEGYLEKARQQIENGLRLLADRFQPRKDDQPVGLQGRPDQRYWWMQLHRLVASKGESKFEDFNYTLQALERLSEGCFRISWQGAAVAFWTDVDNEVLDCKPEWEFSLEGQSTNISVVTAGRNFIKKACIEKLEASLFCSDKWLEYYNSRCLASSVNDHELQSAQAIHSEDAEKEVEISTSTSSTEGEGDTEISKSDVSINEDKNKENVTEVPVKKQVPTRILLGNISSGERNIYWEFGHKELPNRHILVFGASGTGKTYTIQALLSELKRGGQNSLIVDYTDGFTNEQLEPIFKENLNVRQHYIRKSPLAINPFREQFELIDNEKIPEGSASTAQRVAGVFSEVYHLGEQQKSALYKAIKEGIEQESNSFNFSRLIKRLENIRESGGPTANPAASVVSKIQPFVDMNPFGEEDASSWEKIFSDNESSCHVIQLTGFVKEAARLITEFSLFDLYWYYRTRGNKDNPKIIVLDETQNLSHSLEKPLGKFLTEGRKFGISLILATQTLSNLDRDERDRLFQASHKLFFKPADTEVKSFAQILSNATGDKTDTWIERLSSLKRGECYSLGHAYNDTKNKLEVNRWFKIQVKSLENRYQGGR